ncbi:hypothetical protein AAMO2058_001169900 [Amorphochlora amoebiformis]
MGDSLNCGEQETKLPAEVVTLCPVSRSLPFKWLSDPASTWTLPNQLDMPAAISFFYHQPHARSHIDSREQKRTRTVNGRNRHGHRPFR